MIFENPIIRQDMEEINAAGLPLEDLRGVSVLITGATGMIASYLVDFLMYLNMYKDMNITVYEASRNELKAKERFGDFWDNHLFNHIKLDLMNPEFMRDRCDYIVHAAGPANPRMYSTNPVEVLEPNLIGTYNVLNLAKKWNAKGVLFFSSGDVYGKVDEPNTITEGTIGKVDHMGPHSCYTEGKRIGETLCKAFWVEYSVPTKCARIGHTYGPTMDLEGDPRVFASFVKCAIEGKDIVMLSDGTTRRPFCYITDAIKAYLLILLRGENGEAYNVCNCDQFLSIKEFADIVASSVPDKGLHVVCKGRDEKDGYTENKDNVDNKPLSDKLKSLGWECSIDVKDGINRTIRYLQGKTN